MQDKNSRIVRTCDKLAITGFAMLILCHAITTATLFLLSNHAQNIQDVTQAYESAPLSAMLVGNLTGLSFIIQYIALPAILAASYWTIRKMMKRNTLFLFWLTTFVFLAALLNITNDLSALIGVLARNGLL